MNQTTQNDRTNNNLLNFQWVIIAGLFVIIGALLSRAGSVSVTPAATNVSTQPQPTQQPFDTTRLARLHRESLDAQASYEKADESLVSAEANLKSVTQQLEKAIARLTDVRKDGSKHFSSYQQIKKRLPILATKIEVAKQKTERARSRYLSVSSEVAANIDRIEREQQQTYRASMTRYTRDPNIKHRWIDTRTGRGFSTTKDPNTWKFEDKDGYPAGGTNPSLEQRIRAAIQPEQQRENDSQLAFESASTQLQTLITERERLIKQEPIFSQKIDLLLAEMQSLNEEIPQLKDQESKLHASIPQLEIEYENSKKDYMVASNLYELEQRRFGGGIQQQQFLASY